MAIETSFKIPVITPEDIEDPERLLTLLTTMKLFIEELSQKGAEA